MKGDAHGLPRDVNLAGRQEDGPHRDTYGVNGTETETSASPQRDVAHILYLTRNIGRGTYDR